MSVRMQGSLHGRALKLEHIEGYEFHLYSSQSVRLLSQAPSSQRQSLSLTPSPHKHSRPFELVEWNLYLCQRKYDDHNTIHEESTGSETEDDDCHVTSKQHSSSTSTWYHVKTTSRDVEQLCKQVDKENWDQLESSIRASWEKSLVNVAARQQDQGHDGVYSHVRVSVLGNSSTITDYRRSYRLNFLTTRIKHCLCSSCVSRRRNNFAVPRPLPSK